jgi:perosamine synthetase
MVMAELALHGGPKVRTGAWPKTGKRFGKEELKELKEALDQNTLFYMHGTKTPALCARMANLCGRKYVIACSSGSAAVHGAVKACGVGPGDEVITSPVTDAGTILGVVYEGGIPVFADIDPESYNLTAATIERKISPRTKAVILVHLGGIPADVEPIAALCKARGIKLIEDCAQSWGAKMNGTWVGTFGDVAAFSFNDYKHVSAGEGGLIVTDDHDLYATAWRAIDKCYDRLTGKRDVYFVAPNYRITELQSAVGIAQLGKVNGITSKRHLLGDRLSRGLAGIPGIRQHAVPAGGYATYWYYLIGIEPDALHVDASTFGRALNAEGIPGSGRFYMEPVHLAYSYLSRQTAFHHSTWPFSLASSEVSYQRGICPAAEAMQSRVFYFPLDEWLSVKEIDDTVAAVRKVADFFRNGGVVDQARAAAAEAAQKATNGSGSKKAQTSGARAKRAATKPGVKAVKGARATARHARTKVKARR